MDPTEWLYKRNIQCNYDTILQAISLRSQPDILQHPQNQPIKFNEFSDFGFLFEQQSDEAHNCWNFIFEVQHPSVFDNGISELGALYTDCHGIPMIKTDAIWDKLPDFLDTSDELRNIYFKVLSDEN
jgi:hypothetical protein